jgi:hypothetical protein
MFARGVVSLHTAHLPVPKTLKSKSRVSITSKLIQNKGLQVFCFGHLRKTGGRGVLLSCHERSAFFAPRVLHRGRRASLLASRQNSPKSSDSHTYAPPCCKSNVSPTYAKTGG